ncbi:conserved hypothetical protein [Pyrenophora tritici-repentis Pt-1C-BFP]|uniref:Uncharacterized protein n=1 Tax=Pyrenophora tritici-repentis (strain Pt-1C-BFP) TaxID=426418 RepID=B2VTJ6_PYRTR|nr:uncharacterized protein PTRG_01960 [Pyrenophora tritici-repentis Pt-1C-BFP]EDU41398.1 conserved hypothetical protein [Pyrenophora tritici-repentis Pt-1C-BFP]
MPQGRRKAIYITNTTHEKQGPELVAMPSNCSASTELLELLAELVAMPYNCSAIIFFIATIFAGYIALEFVLKALPGVVAQAFDGNCSVVYVTVPGPIITVSLVAASPTNPARASPHPVVSVLSSREHQR